MNVEELRRRHARFIYHDFYLERKENSLEAIFHYEIEPGIHFRPKLTIHSVDDSNIRDLSPDLVDALFFSLGMIDMLSYWKAACSPEIVVKAGTLNEDQSVWWEDLLLNGMGEYFYVNKIDFTQDGFVRIRSEGEKRRLGGPHEAALLRASDLVLTSGGKDTALTLSVLQEAGKTFGCLLLNPTRAALDLASAAGCERAIVVERVIDPALLEMNKQGYLNGHTPFSALLAFLGVACSVLFGYRRVVVSNERSSNEGNLQFMGRGINHQYSKSFRFEERFQEYASTYLSPGVEFFSLLRPLYEIQIARLLTDYPWSFSLFRSCNRKQWENAWCGRCPKCLSVFTLLYPFLPEAECARIFGANFFEAEENINLMRELTGFTGHKPFECVGTSEETLAALYLSSRKARAAKINAPAVLRYVEAEIFPLNPQEPEFAERLLTSWNPEHGLPPEYVSIIRKHLAKLGPGAKVDDEAQGVTE